MVLLRLLPNVRTTYSFVFLQYIIILTFGAGIFYSTEDTYEQDPTGSLCMYHYFHLHSFLKNLINLLHRYT